MQITPSSSDGLQPSPNQIELDDVIAEYLRALESNPNFDRESFLQKHPAWTVELRGFIDNHAQISRFVTSLIADETGAVLRHDREPLPRKLGDYELLEVLGQGGMGVVYKARQTSLGRIVALKMLARDHDSGRFQTEAEAAAGLEHPNIVAIYEIGNHEGSPFYSMQFVQGGDLRDHLQREPIAPKQVAQLVAKIAGAVEYAHQRGILHRDLKPGNVLIDPQGEPFVADFGLARRVVDASHRTQTGAVLGTPGYMAPEQADDSQKSVTTSIDVYGLGALLYAMLTGRPPFEGDHPLQVIRQVVDAAPQPPRAIEASIPRDLEMICLKCLEKRPADRYHSAFDLQQDLLRFVRGEPVVARRLEWWERFWRRCRRNPIATGLAAAVVLLMLAAAIGGTALGWKEYHARRLAVEAEKRERDARRQAVARLIDSHMNNGRQAQRLSRQAEALLWYANAAELAQDSAQASDALVRVRRRQRFVPEPVRAALLDHHGPIVLSFHPSSRYLLCADGQSSLYCWDLKTLDLPLAFPNIEGITASAWSNDGKQLAVGNQAGQLNVIDLSTGQTVVHQGMAEAIRAVCFDPSGNWLAVACGKRVEIVDLSKAAISLPDTSANRECELPADVESIAFNDSATRMLVHCRDGLTSIFDLSDTSSQLVRKFEPLLHNPPQNDLGTTLRPLFIDDNRIAILQAKKLQVIDATNGNILQSEDVATGMVWSYDSKRHALAIGSHRQTEFWEFAGRGLIGRLNHREPVTAVCFHPLAKLVATGSLDGRVNLWDVTNGRRIGDLQHQSQVVSMQFSPDGNFIATAQHDGLVRVWKVMSDSMNRVSIPNPARSTQGKLKPVGGEWYLAGTSRQSGELSKLERYSLADPSDKPSPIQLDGQLRDADTTSDGKIVAAAISKSTTPHAEDAGAVVSSLHFLRWTDGLPERPSVELPAPASSVSAQPHGRLVAVALESGETLLIDSTTGQIARRLVLESATLKLSHRVLFSPCGQWLAIYGGASSIELYQQAKNWSLAARIPGRGAGTHVEFSLDSSHLVAVRDSGNVVVWNLHDARQVGPTMEHAESVYQAHFSPDGRWISTACADNYARIYDFRTGELACQTVTHWADVFDAVFSPNGRWLITIGDNALLGIWSARDGGFVDQVPLSSQPTQGPAHERAARVLVSKDGASVVAFGHRGQVDFIHLGEFETSQEVSPISLRLSAELSSSSRIEQGGPSPLAVHDWIEVWNEFSRGHTQHLQLDFADAPEIRW